MKLRLKACKKCGGDYEKEKEDYGDVWHCIQCGFREPIKEERND